MNVRGAKWWLLGTWIVTGAGIGCGSDRQSKDGAIAGSSDGGSDAGSADEQLGGSAGDVELPSMGGVAAGGRTGAGAGAPSVAPQLNLFLGAPCQSDAQCGVGLQCLQPDTVSLSIGGPPNGLCTVACSTNSTCEQISPSAGCYQPNDQGYCIEACNPGEPKAGISKCHGRTDFACAPFSMGSTFLCVPLCTADAQCGHGLHCDPKSGECVQQVATGEPPGSPCDPSAANDPCQGFCLQTSEGSGVCAELCVAEQPCLYEDGTPHGACFGQFASQATFGPGDIGFCDPNCMCSDDCLSPDDRCRAWGDTALEIRFGAKGLCYPDLAGRPELTCSGATGEAGAAGASQ